MVLFNETFVANKKIYYPSNWETGKTAIELHQEFKLTFQYFLLSNAFQIVASVIWILVLGTIFSAFKELIRLYRLPQSNRERLENKKFLENGFLFAAAVLAIISSIVTIILLLDEWTRNALVKGLIAWGIAYLGRYLYNNWLPFFEEIKQRRAQSQTKKHQVLVEQSNISL